MSPEQRKRMDKMLSERHFLLDVRRDATDLKHIHFSVSGSTGNVYKLLLDLDDSPRLECDCPDFVRHASRHLVLCKHACFVLRRVLRQAHDGRLCYQHPRRFLVHAMRASIAREAERLLQRSFEHECSEVVNRAYLQRYRASVQPPIDESAIESESNGGKRKHKEIESDLLQNFGLGRRSDWSEEQAALQRLDTECCPICFEDFDAQQMLVRCGVCENFAHRACLDKWLAGSQNSNCVFCRSELAYALYVDSSAAAAGKTSAVKRSRFGEISETYINVADTV